ncbi:MAG TPA: hypothetical protein VF434_02920 [Promineifilum sp.]
MESLTSRFNFTAERAAHFDELQKKLAPLWRLIGRTNPGGEVQDENTLVVLPSLTADIDMSGSAHKIYEERFLFMTFLLRQPHLRMIYLTSQPVSPLTIEYYLHSLPDVTVSNARKRLFLLSPQDASNRSLVEKVLERPWFVRHILDLIPNPDLAHLVPFLTTDLERELALQLDIPMYAADPRHYALGGKSGARRIFAEEGLPHPLGREDITGEEGFVDAILSLRARKPGIGRVITKHNQGVSGIGNAVVDLRGLPPPGEPAERPAVLERLRAMSFEVPEFNYDLYLREVKSQGAIVEEMIEGEVKRSPSVQMRISPLGKVEILSTHDQMLGGPSGQSYLGAIFPADPAYSRLITREAAKIGRRFVGEGIVGRFAIDFLTVQNALGEWEPFAIEINLRKGGTTHPFLTLQYLTDGIYDPESGEFTTELGERRYYVASDHVESPAYRVFTPDDLLDLISVHRLTFDQTCQTGVILHMFSAVGELGRLGVTCIHGSAERARGLYEDFVALLDREAGSRLATP